MARAEHEVALKVWERDESRRALPGSLLMRAGDELLMCC
jgi:hypothetical protein